MTQQEEANILPSKNDVIASVKGKISYLSKQSKILLVDDETDIVTVYEKRLKSNGFEIQAYSDPKKALSDFKRDAFDLVILDIRMPKMSGFELCREIRKRDGKVKICLMTAFEIHLKEFEKVLPSIKVDGFITKPAGIVDLCSIVQKIIANSNGRVQR